MISIESFHVQWYRSQGGSVNNKIRLAERALQLYKPSHETIKLETRLAVEQEWILYLP